LSWDHELYSAGHLIQAAIAHVRGRGDERHAGSEVERAHGVTFDLALLAHGQPVLAVARAELRRLQRAAAAMVDEAARQLQVAAGGERLPEVMRDQRLDMVSLLAVPYSHWATAATAGCASGRRSRVTPDLVSAAMRSDGESIVIVIWLVLGLLVPVALVYDALGNGLGWLHLAIFAVAEGLLALAARGGLRTVRRRGW
jgi:hypothetical protein